MTLPVTRELVERTADALSAGGWRYTLRQLYYAACADAEIPPNNATSTGEIATGALLVLVALILVQLTIVFAALLALGTVLILVGLATRLTRRPPAGRVLAISYTAFAHDHGDAALPGLIREARPQGASEGADIAVICDTAETAAAVEANLERAGLSGVSVLTADAVPPHGLRSVVALHDASPRGCAMVLELRDVGLDIVDAGLRPADVDSAASQVLEGAPARMPRDLKQLLSDDEIAWLMSGRRVELATRSPEQLLALVSDAVGRLQPTPAEAQGAG